MGMSEEMDAAPPNPALEVRNGSDRLQDDLRWFDDFFLSKFPTASESDRFFARYWYITGLQRAADYEADVLAIAQTQMQAALEAVRRVHTEFN